MSAGSEYSFEPYLKWRDGVDYFRDDAILQRLLKHYAGSSWQQAADCAERVSALASTRWRRLANEASDPRKHPELIHYDAHNRRIDRIRRAAETVEMEREIFRLGLFSEETSHWQRLIQLFLVYQNGEASICCPLTCTEGLAAMLDRFADRPELERIREHVKQGIDSEFAIGAQYLSEIQGGSDVNANRVEARQMGGKWRVFGKKFFCSAAHADYALLSAKPTGSDRVAAFLVPSWLPGDKEKERRNGHRLERLKWKMGTCELPTAEIEFDGALAYPLGPLEQGLSNLVGIVLSASRITVGIFSAAVMTRAAREARAYAEFRQAFGRKIADFPLLAEQLEGIESAAQRTTAGVFRLAQMIEQREAAKDPAAPDARLLEADLRLLIMLQKITAAADSVKCLHAAVSVFGGHGAIEDFSSLPRLLRDAMVNELWEGPRNVLLTQIHRDLQKTLPWNPLDGMLLRLLGGSDAKEIEALLVEGRALLEGPSLSDSGDRQAARGRRWSCWCDRLMHGFQQDALIAAG